MSKPVQLIINGVKMPTQTRDRYRSYPSVLAERLEMIAGNMVEEVRGTVQIIEYTCDAMDGGTYKLALEAIRRPGPLQVAYLPDDGSTELITSNFLLTSFTPPSLSFYHGTQPVWHGLSLTLREERPHD